MSSSWAEVRYSADGCAAVRIHLRLAARSRIACYCYPDQPPILAVEDASADVSISPPGSSAVTDEDVSAARELLRAVTEYVTEIEEWAARPGVTAAGREAAGAGARP